MSVRDKCGTREATTGAQAYLCRDFVSDETDHARECQHRQVRKSARMDQPIDRFDRGNRGRREDREYDDVSRPAFETFASKPERNAERDRRQRVAAVMN